MICHVEATRSPEWKPDLRTLLASLLLDRPKAILVDDFYCSWGMPIKIQGVWVVSQCFTYWTNSSNSLVNCGLCLKNRRFQILHRFATESANVFQTTSEQHENQYLNSNLGPKHVGLQPMQVVHFRCTIDYPGIASRCQLFTSSRPYLWRASYTDVGQGTLTPFKLAWLQSVNHQDITRNNWNDVASPKQEQVHHNMFLMDVQLWLPASKLMYVNFHCIQHHQFGGASACRRTWRCPPSHP